MHSIDMTKVVPPQELCGEDAEETEELRQLHERARRYLLSFGWCERIDASFFGLGVGCIVGVFLFQIKPAREGVDDWMWVVVGDIPPAYICVADCPNPACALDGYLGEMYEWVDAVLKGKSTKSLIPVNVAPTVEWAKNLQSRLDFIKREILSGYCDDLSNAPVDTERSGKQSKK